jgi:hypothetical protein
MIYGYARVSTGKRVAATAGVAIGAIATVPTDCHPLAMAPSGHTGPDRVDDADNLVSRADR